jgi:uncharacterized membrane protein/predicted DsbA family dithiol-disulfide isomerase
MTYRRTAFLLLSLLALAVSSALLADHARPRPAFCPFGGGCAEVSRSAFASPLGVPLPAVGLVVFGALFGLALFPAGRAAAALRVLAVAAGLAGLGLAAVQALVLGRLCPPCLVVDAAAVALAALGLLLPRPAGEPGPRPAHRWGWAGLACLAAAAPVLWSVLHPPPEVPPQIRALWVRGPVNVVEITDFACHHCRRAHRVLRQVLRERREPVHLVRLVVPLEYHTGGRPAARAYLCAARQGKGEQLADALFEAEDLSPAGLRELARVAGLDLKKYDACLADPAVDGELDRTARWVKAAHGGGVPLLWVRDELLPGVQPPASLRAALDRAAAAPAD